LIYKKIITDTSIFLSDGMPEKVDGPLAPCMGEKRETIKNGFPDCIFKNGTTASSTKYICHVYSM